MSPTAQQGSLPDFGIVVVLPPRLPIVNCPFLIFSASSMPPMTDHCGLEILQSQHRAKSLLHSSMIRSILLFRYLLFGPAPASAIRPSLSNRRLRGGKQRNHPVLISVGTRWLFAKPYIQQLRDVWEQHGRPRIPMQARVVAAPIATKIGSSEKLVG